MADGTAKPVIFISYSHKDRRWLEFVQGHLQVAVTNNHLETWDDRRIEGGADWEKEIDAALWKCAAFVLLVSRHSLVSSFILKKEVRAALDAHWERGVRIYPIVVQACDIQAVPWLTRMNLRPRDARALALYPPAKRDEVMASLAAESRDILKSAAANTSALPPSQEKALLDFGRLPETFYERLVGRAAELRRLDDAWTDPKTNIISLIAEGGAGKSALVNEWLKRLQADNYRGADAVLGWSFYSQGSKERATAADEFLNWALKKLGIKLETTSATAKGEAIAEEMMRRKVLLLLDGVEPLQHGLDTQLGQMKDPGLRALLRRFAATPPGAAHGLVVITSRLAVKDIARWNDKLASAQAVSPPLIPAQSGIQNASTHEAHIALGPRFRGDERKSETIPGAAPVVDVERLSDEAGAALLRDNGVWGTDKELKTAAHDFGGHPLALGLLASFLKETQTGDARRRDHIRGLLADADNPGHDHARRVMESYEKEWLAEQPVLLAIMHVIGLFDRPSSGDCLKALRAKPAIKGLTDEIVKLDDDEWQRAVARLREARLLAPPDLAALDALDTHPLVREWFGELLKRTNDTAWKAAHGRLYEHLRDTTKEGNTPTFENLAPLFRAIIHGCHAGRQQEVLQKIYTDRICRRTSDGQIEFYSMRKLGVHGSNLAAISWFFDRAFETPSASLTTGRSWVLNEAALALRAQGRFSEAMSALRTGLLMDENEKDWDNAATGTNILAEVQLVVGEIAAAISSAKQAVTYADRSGKTYDTVVARAVAGYVAAAAGGHEAAKRLFAEAERKQKQRTPRTPMLHSGPGLFLLRVAVGQGYVRRCA